MRRAGQAMSGKVKGDPQTDFSLIKDSGHKCLLMRPSDHGPRFYLTSWCLAMIVRHNTEISLPPVFILSPKSVC